MLNKEICKKCRINRGHTWGEETEEVWDKGKLVSCYLSYREGFYISTEELPKCNCPYYMEHVVLSKGVKQNAK